jgi:hypothetical protein
MKHLLLIAATCGHPTANGKIIAFIEENANHGKTKTKGKG